MTSEISLPRKKFSSDDAKLYKSLGSLIKEYRQWREISQESFAELIKISVRELQNWEANRRRVRIENLHDLAECTGIPMQVLVALNADQPIWYSLRKRLFMYSLIEKSQFSSHDLFTPNEKLEDHILLNTISITTEKQMDMVLSCHCDLYGTKKLLQKSVIQASSKISSYMNIALYDCWGHYVAHRICLPITMEVYQELKTQETIEDYLTADKISDIIALGEGVLFNYSTFVANITASSWLTFNGIRILSKIKQKERYMFASHTATKESQMIQKNMKMTFVKDYSYLNNPVCPVIYESSLDFQLRPDGPFGWMINEENYFQEKKLPAIVDKLPSIVDKRNFEKILECTQNIKSKIIGCTNPQCNLYDKINKGNIVSNGTYRTKEGKSGQRFLCKECGKSFCSRTGTIFYDIRSPEEKVLKALKLLAKGMSLQYVVKFMGVKFNTVTRWLEIAALQKEKINLMLINEKDISLTDLDTLWNIVKKKSLRQKTLIYRATAKTHAPE